MEVDWDLHAVVRACCSTGSAASPSNAGAGAPSFPVEAYSQQKSTFQDQNSLGFFPDLFQTRSDNSIEHLLNDFNHPLDFQSLRKLPPSPQSLPISPLSVLGGLQDPSHQQAQKQLQGKQPSFGISRCTTSHAQSTRSKKRKNQMKKVCQVPAEGLSTDVWSWRKYGQKPIKGSPYPRGYYRCSTSKGCLARKQVERNRSDPDMFIVTFTGEHNHPVPTHRNSLAGSTRNKPTTSGDEDNTKKKPTSSLPVSPPASVSPATEKPEDNDRDDTDDDNFDLVMDDDFFEGLDELVNPATRDNSPVFIPETSPVAPSFPWLSNNVSTTSTTAAGGS